MQAFTFNLPTKIIFGAGTLSRLKKNIKGLGKKALIVIGQGSVKKYGYLKKVTEQLDAINVESIIFEGIEPNPRVSTIDKAAELARKANPKFVIALGGGSVMDAAKCISMLAVNEGSIWDYAYRGGNLERKPFQKALPLICIPTVAATSSETDRYAVVTNSETREKTGVFGDAFFPLISIIDPELTFTLPQKATVDGAIDIIVHVLESYLSSSEETPLQDRFSLAIVKTVMDYLSQALNNGYDISARTQLSWCSSLAISGFLSGRDGGWPMHAMEHVLSGYYDISHGEGLAVLLPAILKFDLPYNIKKIAELGRYLFSLPFESSFEKTATNSISSFIGWLKKVGAYKTLDQIITNNNRNLDFEKMAGDVVRLSGNYQGYLPNIVPMSKQDIINIFESVTR